MNVLDTKFLTVAEVATALRVSKMAVYRLIHTGELAAIRIGKSYRIPEQAANEFLKACFDQAGGAR